MVGAAVRPDRERHRCRPSPRSRPVASARVAVGRSSLDAVGYGARVSRRFLTSQRVVRDGPCGRVLSTHANLHPPQVHSTATRGGSRGDSVPSTLIISAPSVAAVSNHDAQMSSHGATGSLAAVVRTAAGVGDLGVCRCPCGRGAGASTATSTNTCDPAHVTPPPLSPSARTPAGQGYVVRSARFPSLRRWPAVARRLDLHRVALVDRPSSKARATLSSSSRRSTRLSGRAP